MARMLRLACQEKKDIKTEWYLKKTNPETTVQLQHTCDNCKVC